MKWPRRNVPVQQYLANQALKEAQESQKRVEEYDPRVQAAVAASKRLMLENHFAERLSRAYR